MGAEEIGRIDAKTGKIAIYKTPTPESGRRRGMMDAEDCGSARTGDGVLVGLSPGHRPDGAVTLAARQGR